MIDNIKIHQTPEGVELSLVPAGITLRFWAWMIDFVIRHILLYMLVGVLNYLGKFGFGLFLIVYFLLDWFYFVVFEVFNHGQTLGKKWLKLRVCQDDGTPIGWQASMVRNLLRYADFLPFAFLTAIVSMLFNRSSKRLGDIVAGTLVVHVMPTDVCDDIPVYPPIALPFLFELDEQQAILAFAERVESIPEQRLQELANLLVDLPNQNHEDMPTQILGYANSIVGRDG